jgi:uncharacterized membrane protein
MADTAVLGPVQLVVVELENDKLHGQIVRELTRLRESGTVRILDLLFVAKQQDDSLVTIKDTDLTTEQRMAYGAVIGGLLGLEAGGVESAEVGAEAGALAFADQTFGLSNSDIRDIASEIPRGKAALFILFEHHWALGIKDAMLQANGIVRAQGLVRPETLEIVSDLMMEMQADMEQEGGQPSVH